MNPYDICYLDEKNDVAVTRIGRVYDGRCTLLRLCSSKKPIDLCFIMDDCTTRQDYCDAIKSHITRMNMPYSANCVTL